MKLHSQAKTNLTPSTETIAVLVAEVLSKIRTVLSTMSYSDMKNVVSNSSSRIFNEKIDSQRIHDSKKSANTAPMVSIQTNKLPNSANAFCKMDELKILQCNCRGLNKKICDLILFSREEEIDVICLNEVRSWKKTTPPQHLHRCNGNLQQRSS